MERDGTASRAPARGSRLAVAAATLALLLPASALSQGEQPAPDAKDKGKASKQKAAPAGPPKLDARAWILIDPRDDEVLASSAPNRELPIASATNVAQVEDLLGAMRLNLTATQLAVLDSASRKPPAASISAS